MAGHSQFKNIMHRKGAQDAKRAKKFNKLAREITVASKGNPDPDANPRLRGAIAAARAENMPKDRINRAIASGQPGGDDTVYEEVRYEGYGPGGAAVIVEALTDNRNRTAAEVRSTFTKHGGSLAETGAVSFQFERVGEIIYPADKASGDDMFEAALEAGAENVESDSNAHNITCAVDDFSTVRDALAEKFGDAEGGGLTWKPQNTVPLDEGAAETMLKMIDVLEDNDDVQSVSANFDIDEATLQKLAS